MFRDSVVNANENNYNVKVVKSGSNLKLKSYSEIQTRVKCPNPDKLFDVLGTECPDIFNTKTGEIIDLVDFEKLFLNGEITKQQYFFTKEKHIYHSLNYLEKKIRNKLISLRRSKEKIVNLVNANVSSSKEHTKFLTLTFEENITDVKTANILFKKFMMRLNHYFKKNMGMEENIKYISVLENQKRGAIHYHLVMFNAPYLPFEIYMKIWGLGGVYVESLMKDNKKVTIDCSNGDFTVDGEIIDNIGAYITKTIDYITKGFKELEDNLDILTYKSMEELKVIFTENAKIFQASRNLEQPFEIYLTVNYGFKKVLNYLKYFYDGKIYSSTFENELFEMESLVLNYKEDLEEINVFLELLEGLE